MAWLSTGDRPRPSGRGFPSALQLPEPVGVRFAKALRELPVDAVGVDLTETDLESLRGSWRTGLLAGCLDGRSSGLEDVDATAALASRIVETARPPLLLLSSAGDLELVPRTVAEEKVRVLGAATRRLREELAC